MTQYLDASPAERLAILKRVWPSCPAVVAAVFRMPPREAALYLAQVRAEQTNDQADYRPVGYRQSYEWGE